MEKTLSSERMFDGRLLKVDRLEVELDDGRKTFREMLTFPDVVVVLACDDNGRVMLVRQFRKPIEAELLEAIAGKVDPGETPEEAARRELKEETGYSCGRLKKVGVVHPTSGYSTERQHYFITKVVGNPERQSGDDGKKISVVWMDEDALIDHVATGVPMDGKLLAAVAFSFAFDAVGKFFDEEDDDRVCFVSGHLDLTQEEFDAHYRDRISEAVNVGCRFVVGDAKGADLMAQDLIRSLGGTAVVYHMFQRPRNNPNGFPTKGGYKSDFHRDSAMTEASMEDIAWVRPGKTGSGTEKNLARRSRDRV